jgi:ribosomal protein L25 (general stress protein Ctc)
MDYEAMRVDLVNAGVRAGTTEGFVSVLRETEALQLAIYGAAQRGEPQLATMLRDDFDKSSRKLDEAVAEVMAQSAELGTKVRAMCEGDGLLPSRNAQP